MARTSNNTFIRRPRGGWFSLPVFLYTFFFIVLFGAAVMWRANLEGALMYALVPVEHLRADIGASENARLRAELASTTALLADRDALYQENLELKSRLGRDASVHVMLAGVLQRPPATAYDTLLVDAGSAEGVVQGQLVSAGGTTLIGSVAGVYAHTSRVVLFSAPGETYDVMLRGSIPVEMQGQGGGSLRGQVPAGTAVSIGDTLLFPGIASGLAGEVSAVDAQPGNSFITLYAHLPVDPLTLQFVEIQTDARR